MYITCTYAYTYIPYTFMPTECICTYQCTLYIIVLYVLYMQYLYNTNTAIYCELGILPFSFHTKTAVVKYHERLIKQPIPSLLLDAYNLSITLAREGLESWYSLMNKFLQSLGLNFNDSSATHAYTSDIVTRIQDQHLQKLDLQLHNPTGSSAWGGNKLRYYCRFKHKIHNQAKHLVTIQNPTMRRYLTNFRISSHNLSIERGRYTVPPTPLHERKCILCNCNQIEDEPHFLISCPRYTDIRQHMLTQARMLNSCFNYLCTMDKFVFIMSSENCDLIQATAKFIFNAMKRRSQFVTQRI